MKRLFIAIPLPDNIRTHINEFSKTLHKIEIDGTFVATENLHLTIKFLGNVDEKNIDTISSLISKEVATVHKFSASVKNVGVFPSLDCIQTV